MKRTERARAMRAEGKTRAEIAEQCGMSLGHAYRITRDIDPAARDDATTVIRHGAHNGGCSTLSGMMPVRMPRISALHGAFA